MIDLLIADDHAIFREGLRQILAAQADMRVSGEASDGDGVLSRLRQGRFDVLILDMSMPNRGGVALIAQIRALHPRLPILVLSMHQEHQYAVQAIRAGAAGYVVKASPSAELLEGVRRVARGGTYVSESIAERLVRDLREPEQRLPHAEFTAREFQIFHMLIAGLRVSDIARALNLSEKTVSTHKTRIQQKIDAHSVAEMVRYAVKHRLIESGEEPVGPG
ncbi:MAG TPA: response regulator transcription factor [Stellaceae bacterium]|nr:response regulator transcription factor [Stellaceae bacterium]